MFSPDAILAATMQHFTAITIEEAILHAAGKHDFDPQAGFAHSLERTQELASLIEEQADHLAFDAILPSSFKAMRESVRLRQRKQPPVEVTGVETGLSKSMWFSTHAEAIAFVAGMEWCIDSRWITEEPKETAAGAWTVRVKQLSQ